MTEIIGVRFKSVGKIYYFSPNSINVPVGEHVIVETSRGIEYGEVVIANKQVEDEKIISPLKPVIRVATEEDANKVIDNEKKQKEAFKICLKKIAARKLEMNLISAEYTFDRGKLLFYFTADGRIDFRDLVKDLASVFHTRIELRQIGVRDEAKLLGGLGVCGRPLCCASFLEDFEPVSINMAKEQNLSLNPTKISGTCGRLMCCLKYENDAYEHLIAVSPTVDSIVDTPDGKGVVTDLALLKGSCCVRLDKSPDCVKCYKCCDCEILKRAKRKNHTDNDEDIDEYDEY